MVNAMTNLEAQGRPMRFTDKIAVLVFAYGLWVVMAFAFGVLTKPVVSAFLTGYAVWGL